MPVTTACKANKERKEAARSQKREAERRANRSAKHESGRSKSRVTHITPDVACMLQTPEGALIADQVRKRAGDIEIIDTREHRKDGIEVGVGHASQVNVDAAGVVQQLCGGEREGEA